jgi:parallel beta-helix repeat protein
MRLFALIAFALAGCSEAPIACSTNQDCAKFFQGAVCSMNNVCVVPDLGTVDMSGDMAMCMSSNQCDDAHPICDNGMCRACVQGANDDAACGMHNSATPVCGAAGLCVACIGAGMQSTNCASTMPICDANNTCRTCAAHSECSSGVCKSDGSCADPAQILYVNNNAGKNCMATGPGTQASPYCEIAPAATAAVTGALPYVVVAGSATAYTTGVTLSTATMGITGLTIVGPGRVATMARLAPSTVTHAISLSTLGQPATITIDGLELVGQGTGSSGVKCAVTTGGATVTVKNSLIDSSGAAGIDASGCSVTLDSNVISGNGGGGIKLASSTYTITNNIVWGNGSGAATAAGVSLDTSSAGTFAFNTVAKNTVTAGVGGVDCGTGAVKTLSNSIVWSNTLQTGTQLGPQCMLTNVVTVAGDDNRGLMVATKPDFVSATDFHLQSGTSANTACCIDKIVTSPGTPNQGHDVDATTRPKGLGWDYGAHEVQ